MYDKLGDDLKADSLLRNISDYLDDEDFQSTDQISSTEKPSETGPIHLDHSIRTRVAVAISAGEHVPLRRLPVSQLNRVMDPKNHLVILENRTFK